MHNARIVIVEDNEALLEECARWLREAGHEVHCARDAQQGLSLIVRLMPELVLLDLRLPPSHDPSEGLNLLKECMKVHPLAKVIVLTVEDRKEVALEAVRCGAEDFMMKPVDPDVLGIVVDRSLKKQSLEMEVRRLRFWPGTEGGLQGMIGRTRAMQELYDLVLKTAESGASLLIQGESGTGKDLVASAVHELSPRGSQRLVTVNCAAIAESIQESELFGHERWAFTDAKQQRLGAFELAHGGTIFLDEIESMSPKTQANLLRVIESKQVHRLGAQDPREVDFRVISATNKDLKSLVAQGLFREDLYYRINTITLNVPPLRERRDDIEALANHFLKQISQEENKKILGFDDEVIELFRRHPWPGNVRELRNEVHWLVIQAEQNQIIYREMLSPGIRGQAGTAGAPTTGRVGLKEALEAVEREMILEALRGNSGNITRAAEELGVTRQNLHFKIHKHGLG